MLKRTILIENPCHLNVTNDLFQITYKLSNPTVETGLRPVSTSTTNPPVETGLRPVSTSSSTNPPVKTGLRPVSTTDSTTIINTIHFLWQTT